MEASDITGFCQAQPSTTSMTRNVPAATRNSRWNQNLYTYPHTASAMMSSELINWILLKADQRPLALDLAVLMISNGMLELIDVPMPFFTGVLYVNEVVLGILISLLTSVRSYKEGKNYDQFLENIVTVASALQPLEWKNILTSVQGRMRLITTGMVTVFIICLVCDYLHFRSLYALSFSLGAYMMPNILVTLSFLQCCFGVLLIYKLLQSMRQRLSAGELTRCDPMQRVAETERHYLQLTACMELITRSYEFLIVVNTFAGINVTSLQLLEIYQHLHVKEANEVYIAYNIFWITMQLFILLMILYPCHLVKREIFVALLSFLIILIQFDSANLNKHKGAITTMDSLYNSI
uniref:Gustatory receptor n=1 Tax=Anopheles atroparvus TaxID=41427 RepID=A0A182J1A6_ANOAO